MRAAGALPTEERVKQMNDPQWLWYYLNLEKDKDEDDKRTKNYIEYLTWFVNPQLAKSVAEQNKLTSQTSNIYTNQNQNYDQQIVEGDKTVNDEFETELRQALKDSKMEENKFVQLPGSDSVGNPAESQNDFINRAIAFGKMNNIDVDTTSNIELKEDKRDLKDMLLGVGITEDDIDYIVDPDEQ
jgi:hypothetical protein